MDAFNKFEEVCEEIEQEEIQQADEDQELIFCDFVDFNRKM